MPEPPVCSMVSVYDTTLPQRSDVTRCEVEVPAFVLPDGRRGRAPGGVQRARRGRGRQGPVADLAGPGPGERPRQQRLQRHVDEGRVADVGVPVGEGQRGRVEVVVQRLGLGQRRQLLRAQDVERLADRRPAAGGGGDRVDVVPAVAHLRRLVLDDLVALQVRQLQVALRERQRRVLGLRRALHRPDDVLADPTPVEHLRPLLAEGVVRGRQVPVAEHRPDLRRVPARQVEVGGGADLLEPVEVLQRLLAERRVHHEAAPGDLRRRLQRLAQAERAPAVEGLLPGRRGAGHADARPARDQVGGERVRLARRRVDERVARDRPRGGLAPVERRHLPGLGVVVDEVATAADARRVRLGDPEGGGGRHRGVDGVPALAQDLDAGVRRLRVDAGHRTARAEGRRVLLRHASGLAGGRGGGAGRGGGGRGARGPGRRARAGGQARHQGEAAGAGQQGTTKTVSGHGDASRWG